MAAHMDDHHVADVLNSILKRLTNGDLDEDDFYLKVGDGGMLVLEMLGDTETRPHLEDTKSFLSERSTASRGATMQEDQRIVGMRAWEWWEHDYSEDDRVKRLTPRPIDEL